MVILLKNELTIYHGSENIIEVPEYGKGKPSHNMDVSRSDGIMKDFSELLIKHICKNGSNGTPFKELQQVLPGHSRSQIQVLLRELKKAGRISCAGSTSAASGTAEWM